MLFQENIQTICGAWGMDKTSPPPDQNRPKIVFKIHGITRNNFLKLKFTILINLIKYIYIYIKYCKFAKLFLVIT